MGKKPSHPELGHQGRQSLYSFQLKNQNQILREKLTWIVIGLGLGIAATAGAMALGTAKISSLPLLSQPQSAPEAAVTKGLNQGMRAAELTQSADLKEDWIEVAMVWQAAIAQLTAIPPDHPDYPLAQQKITEYQRNLDYAESNVSTRPSALPQAQDYWTLGSDRELVLATQGTPNQIRQLSSSCYETLHYAGSMIELKNGYVKSYDNFDNNLKVLEVRDAARSIRSDDRHWGLGAAKATVVQLQGTPDRSSDIQSERFTTLYYDDSFVLLDQDRVIGYFNRDKNLKISTIPALAASTDANAGGWSLGSSRLEVLQAQQQTPQAISRNDDSCEEIFHFNNSEVFFRQGIVTGYRNVDQNLRLRQATD
jgi:hypothetical protein